MKEEVDGKCQDEWHHDRTETDTGEINGPIRKSEEKSGDESEGFTPPEFESDEVDPEYCERTENSGPEFECPNMNAKNIHREGLEIDEQTFAAIVVFVEELEASGLDGVERVDGIDGFVGVKSAGDGVNLPKAEGESDREEEN